ncbi:MAG: hypothetical protein A2X02_09965 [Bacteroidetes bacterium GWF2_29_10]|nr:MAG: hypothetical protein A2X02_09965 [Bacteroidetes bacterium GWF2_29_10]
MNEKKIKIIGLIIILFFATNHLFSQTFSENGINYNITSSSLPYTVEVIAKDPIYMGDIVIPITTYYDGITYAVTAIGSDAFANCENLNSVSIPNSVTSIGSGAFSESAGLTSITIPNSVTTIGEFAFGYCSGLTSISIPNSVTRIASMAFHSCVGLTNIELPSSVKILEYGLFTSCTGLTSFIVPDSVTIIEEFAFTQCTSLASISFPKSLKSIGAYAFQNNNLKTVVFPDSLITIGNGAFALCYNMVSVTIPSSVTFIDEGAFYNCIGLKSIICKAISPPVLGENVFLNVPTTTANLQIHFETIDDYQDDDQWNAFLMSYFPFKVDGIMYNITSSVEPYTVAVVAKTPIYTGDIIIPSSVMYEGISFSVVAVGNDAFKECEYLTSVVLPNTITTIGDNAFWLCTELASVLIPNSVQYIGNSAFERCYLLGAVTIPNSVTHIGVYAFQNCFNVKSLTINSSNTYIEYGAFDKCSGLQYITCFGVNPPPLGNYVFYNNVPKNIPLYVLAESIDAYNEANQWNEFNVTKFIYFEVDGIAYKITSDSVPYTVEVKNKNPYYTGSLTIPESVTFMGITYSVTAIGNNAFDYCGNLVSVSIPNTVKSMGDYCFRYCRSLSGISIPNSVTNIGISAFDQCSGLNSVILPNSLKSISQNAFFYCSNLTSITLPDSLTTIGASAFRGCEKLSSVIILDLVTTIGNNAFYDCLALTSIICNKATPPTIGTYVFYNIPKSIPIYVPAGSLNAYKGLDQWKDFTNYKCPTFEVDGIAYNITSSNKPYAVEVIAKNPVYAGNINIPTQVILNLDTFIVKQVGNNAFNKCYDLTAVTIPNTVTSIGQQAFYYCVGLSSLTIPNSVTVIGDSAFANCFGASSILMSNSVTTIKSYAFFNCFGFTSFTIPSTVTSIEDNAFKYCSGLTDLFCNAINPPALGANVFSEVTKTIPLTVPPGRANAYKAVEQWKDFTNIIYPPFEIDGIVYNITSDTMPYTVQVVAKTPAYKGDIIIPSSVTLNGVIYSVTKIGDAAFANCNELTSVSIPNSVNTIGQQAFYFCTGLTSITIPDSVSAIEDEAFGFCYSLQSIICNVSTPIVLGVNVFSNVPKSIPLFVPAGSLSAYKEADQWKDFTNIKCPPYEVDGIVYNVTSDNEPYTVEVIAKTPAYEGDIVIPSSVVINGVTYAVTKIGDYAFIGSYGLTSVTIPNSIKTIGGGAFNSCFSLTSITIPNSVTSIGDGAFSSCLSLASFVIPDSITTIGAYLFYNCPNLTSFTINSSITSIGEGAFYNCTGLTYIICNPTTPPALSADVFSGVSTTIPVFVKEEGINDYNSTLQWQNLNILSMSIADAGEDKSICLGNETMLIASGGDSYTWNNLVNNDTIYVSPITSTTYIITVSNAYGFTDIDTVLVNVNENPVISSFLTTGRASCNEISDGYGKVVMAENKEYLYSWNTMMTTDSIYGLPGGDYIVTVTDENGCTVTDTMTIFQPDYFPEVSNLIISTGHTSVFVHWNKNEETTYYFARYRKTGTTTFTSISISGSDTSFSLYNLIPNTNYEMQIRQFKNSTTYSCMPIQNFITKEVAEPNNCNTIINPTISNLTTNTARLTWGVPEGATAYMLRWRVKAGLGPWVYANLLGTTTTHTMTYLLPSTEYEYQIRTFCGGFYSAFTDLVTFRTAYGCGDPTGLTSYDVATTSAVLKWNGVSGATEFNVRYKKTTDVTWKYAFQSGTKDRLQIGCGICNEVDKLSPNTQYQWQIQSYCSVDKSRYSLFSAIQTFTTLSANKAMESTSNSKLLTFKTIEVYPNPANKVLNILNVKQNSAFLIFNTMGQVVYSCFINDAKTIIDISSFEQGVYIIRANNQNFRFIKD